MTAAGRLFAGKGYVLKDIDDVGNIDWKTWQPQEKAVIVYIRTGSGIVLIEKKTGLGAGKVNGPGGRIEKGETPEEAAVRECREEIGVTPLSLSLGAELSFIFKDGYSLFGYAFTADGYTGTLIETDEAKPFICREEDLPYDRMWEDDLYWLPQALSGKKVTGRFIFDNDKMLSRSVCIKQD